MVRGRIVALSGIAAGGLVLLAVAPGAGAQLASTTGPIRAGALRGENPLTEQRAIAAPEAGSVIADSQTVTNQLAYVRQASALPVAIKGRAFTSLGPYGIDSVDNNSGPHERFARVSGMGTTAAADPKDTSGNTLLVGGMGGVWRSTDGGAHWVNLTDGKTARSSVGAVAYDRLHPYDIYVGTGEGYGTNSGDSQGTGVYVSHDNGKTFQRPLHNVEGYATNVIRPTAQGVLVGTSHGLYVTTDRGASFTEILLKSNATHTAHQPGAYANWISAIVVNPHQGNVVTVAIGSPYGKRKVPDGSVVTPGNGLYRSVHGARGPFTFMPTSAGLTNPTASTDPLGRISLTYGPTAGQGSALWALVADAGLVNKQQPAGLDAVSAATGRNLNVTSTVLNGLYRSDDDGLTWTLKANPTSLLATPNSTLTAVAGLGYGPGVQAYYNNWVTADPNQPDKVFFGLEEVYQTVANAGPTPGVAQAEVIQRYADICGFFGFAPNFFNGPSCPTATPEYGGQSTHPDQHVGIAVNTPNGTRLYTGNDGGFFREDAHTVNGVAKNFDNDSWIAMNTIATVEAYGVARKPDGEIIIGLQDNGSAAFKPGHTAVAVNGGDGYSVFATKDPNTYYTMIVGGNLFVTRDDGKTLSEIQPTLTNPTFYSPIAMDPTDENHLIAAGNDIEETTLGPNTKTVADNVATGTILTTDWKSIFTAGNSPTVVNGVTIPWAALAIGVRGASAYVAECGLCRNAQGDPKAIRTAIATNVKAGCAAKKANSACWHFTKGKGLPHVAIQALVVDPQNVRTIYAALNEYSLIGLDHKVVGAARVMVSKDGGDSFTDITGNLPRSNMRDIVVRDGSLIVGGDNGIFTAKIGSTKWSRLAVGLPQARIYDLSLDPSGRHLTISAYGRGIWELDFGTNAKHSSAGPGPTGEPAAPAPSTWQVVTQLHSLAVWALLLVLLALSAVRVRRWRAPVFGASAA